jgi:hypothetical protein
VLWVLREPFSRRALRERRYAALGLLLAIPGFVLVAVGVVVGLGLSLSFAGMLIGLPLLAVSLAGARRLGAVRRRLAARMLGERVAAPPVPPRQPGVVGWIRACVTDPAAWRACAHLVLDLPVAVICAVVASWFLVYGLSYVTFPLWWEVLHQFGVVVTVPGWLTWWKQDPVRVAMSVRTLAGACALVPAGAAMLLAVPWLTRGALAADRVSWSPGCSARRCHSGSVTWSGPGRTRWTTRRRGCARSSGTCTTARRRRWSRSP